MNPTRNHEVAGSLPALAQWVNDNGIAVSCGVGRRWGSDPALLWLWRRLAATAPVRLLSWEPPYAAAAALKRGVGNEKEFLGINMRANRKVEEIQEVEENDKYRKE